MDGLGSLLLVAVFLAAAAVIWVAGVHLTRTTDVLADRLRLGSALGGLILLALATNLPEVAIVLSASAAGQLGVAVGNILGGIAIQTVVLAGLDGFGMPRGAPLTHRAASLVIVVEGLAVVAVLGVVVAGTQLPGDLTLGRLAPASVLIAALWLVGLLLVRRAQRGLPWHERGEAPGNQGPPRGHSRAAVRRDAARRGVGTARAGAVFAAAALVTLVAGVVLERSGDALAGRLGLSGVLFGATILAAATALPEVSSGLTAVRHGDDQLAMGDIFGGNAFLPVLFLPAALLSGTAVLPQARATDIYLTAVGLVLTLVYIVGLLFRPTRRIAGMGVDSAVVLALYAVALAGLFTIGG